MGKKPASTMARPCLHSQVGQDHNLKVELSLGLHSIEVTECCMFAEPLLEALSFKSSSSTVVDVSSASSS